MCGLNGIFAFHHAAGLPSRDELVRTRDHMRARGPDGSGEWWSLDRRIGMGHRRLSIIDLSSAGDQPMRSRDGELVVVFNGEIYNYPELRRELEGQGIEFSSGSDTEVLLHLYRRDGPAMVSRLRGMFALALWDHRSQGLLLARDPYGIKPLYISDDGWTFRFASQVKALLAGGRISRDPDPAGQVGFHLWGSVPDPFTLYHSVRALPAGHIQWIDRSGPRPPEPYISIAAILTEGARARSPADQDAHVRDAVLNSVGAHLLADVEVGIFLSAGVDSGALLGLMRDAGQSRVRAITLAFEEFRSTPEDESILAARIAQTYGAEHVVRFVDRAEFEDDLPRILETMDQPSIDGVNTWFVSKAAREAGLKVALSGVGGDEILAGYPSFVDIPRWVRRLSAPARLPGAGRLARLIGQVLGLSRRQPKALGLLEYGGSFEGAYLLRRGLYLPFELGGVMGDIMDRDMVREGLRRLAPLASVRAAGLTPDPKADPSRIAALESCWYMRNQLLRDSDWAGMAHSLEIRTPFVDCTLLRQLAPVTARLRPGEGKRALARAPSTPLPPEITERPKTGFGVPTGRWIAEAAGGRLMTKGGASRAWASTIARSAAAPSADVAV
jgi:asparagine synthase (glutamine-hydrolysing)